MPTQINPNTSVKKMTNTNYCKILSQFSRGLIPSVSHPLSANPFIIFFKDIEPEKKQEQQRFDSCRVMREAAVLYGSGKPVSIYSTSYP